LLFVYFRNIVIRDEFYCFFLNNFISYCARVSIVSLVRTLFFCLIGSIVGLVAGFSYSERIVGSDPDLVNIFTFICVLIGIRIGQQFSRIKIR
jgi:hypothetical protein